MLIQVSEPYVLTPEQETILKSYVDIYAGDFRVMVEGKRVFFYVAAWQGDIAWKHIGSFSNPNAVMQAVYDHPIYKDSSKFSAAAVVLRQIAKMPSYAP